MSLLLDITPETERWLEEQSRRSGDSVSTVALRVLERAAKPFVVTPFDIGPFPERFQGMTPTEIDYELEMEAYQETLERARR